MNTWFPLLQWFGLKIVLFVLVIIWFMINLYYIYVWADLKSNAWAATVILKARWICSYLSSVVTAQVNVCAARWGRATLNANWTFMDAVAPMHAELAWVMRPHFARKNDAIIFKPIACYLWDAYCTSHMWCTSKNMYSSNRYVLLTYYQATICNCPMRVFPESRLVRERHLCFLVPTLEASPMIAMLIIIIAAMGQTALHFLISLWPPFDTWFNVSGHQMWEEHHLSARLPRFWIFF